jgi:deoxyribose-phosphate aldolase
MSRIERAAGGLVVRLGKAGREVLMIDDNYGHVTFPKGHVEPGETWEDAAIREIREETGVEARVLAPLGRVEYPIERDGEPVRKQVRFFLLEEIDKVDEPVVQEEEIRGAYFLPWNEAKRIHDAKGYANWSWVFDKADVLWRWHEEQWNAKWRTLPASTDGSALDEVWVNVRGTVEDLCKAVRSELAVVAPEIYERLTSVLPASLATPTLPRDIGDAVESVRLAIEHTLLKPEASVLDIENVCLDALRHEFKTVCVHPQHVPTVSAKLQDSSVIPCTVIGFPLGATDMEALAYEARRVVEKGAAEVDMVLPIGSMREDDIWTVYEYIRTVCDTVHAVNAKVKVIFETHFLTYAQVAMSALVSAAAGADFVKTSTGFAASGARLADVALMAIATQGRLGVKASGGIRTQKDAVAFLRYGATRIGTSSGPSLVRK